MNKAYTRINFQDTPSTATPLNAANMNKIDKAISDIDDRVIELAGYQEEAEEAAEMASSSASAAAKAAETATADAEARVNAIIEGLEVFTKEDSQKKFASVIKQTVTGSQLLIKDSVDAGVIDFKGKGRSTQQQYSGKNLLKNTATSQTVGGLTFTVNDDKSIKVSGTVNGANNLYLNDKTYNLFLPSGTYVLSGMGNVSGGTEMVLRVYDGSKVIADLKAGTPEKMFTLTADTNVSVYINFNTTDITYNGTIYPMIRLADTDSTYEPYVGRTAAPNPDYPQEIESVGDSGWFGGELLANMSTADNNGAIGANNGYVLSKDYTPCNSGDVIKIIYGEVARVIRVSFYDNTKTHISTSYLTNITKFEKVAPSNSAFFLFSISNTDSNITPQTAKKIVVTINDTYALQVKSVGKNLLENTATTQTINGITFTINNDGSVTANGTATARADIVLGVLTLKAGKTYKLNGCADGGSVSKYRLQYIDDAINSYLNDYGMNGTIPQGQADTYTPTQDMVNGKVRINVFTGTTLSNVTFYPMIRLAEVTDGTYEPYKETVSYILLSEPLRSSLDGSITDVASLGENKATRKYAEVVFDGSADENWMTAGEGNTQRFYLNVKIAKPTSHDIVANILCDKFTPNTVNYIISDQSGKENCIGVNGIGNIMVRYKELTTVAEWKTWLQTNPITVIYELAEPITETIEPVDIATYNSVTYITATDNAEMEVTYATDTKTYIDNKFAELQAAILATGANV